MQFLYAIYAVVFFVLTIMAGLLAMKGIGLACAFICLYLSYKALTTNDDAPNAT